MRPWMVTTYQAVPCSSCGCDMDTHVVMLGSRVAVLAVGEDGSTTVRLCDGTEPLPVRVVKA